MKALKEKRVSLRSLFRRGLVILSLFALAFAFASCGESGGGGGDPTPTSGPTSPPVTPDVKHVERLEVLKHPTAYSFEAAAVDLNGMRVAVYWDDNGVKSVEVVDVDSDEKAARFYTDPPRADVTNPGENVLAFSATSGTDAYKLFYNDLWQAAPGVPVVIPAVRALDTASTSYTKMTGKVDAVYEDMAIDTSPIQLTAVYVEMLYGYGVEEDSTASPPITSGDICATPATGLPAVNKMGDYDWDKSDAGIFNVPVSSNREVWKLTKKEDDPSKSTLEYNPNTTSATGTYDTKVGNFYYVYKIEWAESSSGKLRDFIADEEEINGDVDWVKELVAANTRFKVLYYTGPDQTLASFSREIGMYEYIKAMFNTAPNRAGDMVPLATVPVIRGSENTDEPYVKKGGATRAIAGRGELDYMPNSILGAALEDFLDDAVLQCFYYYPGIKGDPGKGEYDELASAGTGGTDEEPTSGRTWVNAASIPLSGKIYTYDSIERVRRANTDSLGNAQVEFGRTYPKSLVDNLKTLWDVVYVYVNPNDSSKTLRSDPIDWRKVTASTDTSAMIPLPGTTGGWTNTQADAGDSDSVDITFDLPYSEGGTDEIEFEYDVIQ